MKENSQFIYGANAQQTNTHLSQVNNTIKEENAKLIAQYNSMIGEVQNIGNDVGSISQELSSSPSMDFQDWGDWPNVDTIGPRYLIR